MYRGSNLRQANDLQHNRPVGEHPNRAQFCRSLLKRAIRGQAEARLKAMVSLAESEATVVTKESFGNMFKAACVEAQVHGKSAHGLRKIGATRAANNGATVSQLEALFGWSGGGMASLYTRNADRARLGQQAAGMLVKNDPATSMLSPTEKVGAPIAILK
jgi:integrase